MSGEKSEKATPKRKRDERKKGNVFLSREVVIVFSLLAKAAPSVLPMKKLIQIVQ